MKKHDIEFVELVQPKRKKKSKTVVYITDPEDGESVAVSLAQLVEALTRYFERPTVH